MNKSKAANGCTVGEGGGRGFFAQFEIRKIGAFAANGAKRGRR
jgi:hypothetical protein